MRVSKEKAIATFTYPYQSYGISFVLDEINYEDLYDTFVNFCSYFDGFARSALHKDLYWGDRTSDGETVRSKVDAIFNQVLALDDDTNGFYKYGTIKSDKGIVVNVCFSKFSDTEPRVTSDHALVAPLICFKFELSFLGEERPESYFIMTVIKEKDLKQGLPDWR
jgi:hypothetical protein